MKIEFLFGEVCNFYGDPQNVTYLAQSAKKRANYKHLFA